MSSVPSTSSSSTAATVKLIELAAVLSKVRVDPTSEIPSVTSATACSALKNAGV